MLINIEREKNIDPGGKKSARKKIRQKKNRVKKNRGKKNRGKKIEKIRVKKNDYSSQTRLFRGQKLDQYSDAMSGHLKHLKF